MQEKRNNNTGFSESSVDIAYYLRLLRRKKWTILIIFILVLMVWTAGVIKFSPQPEYETTALLQLEDRRALSAMSDRGRAENSGKIGLLMSRKFLAKVVDKLAMETVIKGVERHTAVDSVKLTEDHRMGLFHLVRKDDNLKLYYTDPREVVKEKLVLDTTYPEDHHLAYGGVDLYFNSSFWEKHNELRYALIPEKNAVESLRNSLTPNFRNRAQTLLGVTIRGTDRYFITKVLNTVIDEFVKQNIEFKKYHTREILNILSEQLDQAREQLDSAEQELKEFRERNPWVGLTADASGVVSELSSQESQKTSLNNNLDELKSLLNRYNNASGDSRYSVLSEILSFLGAQGAATVPALSSELSTLTAERNRLLSNYASSHPVVQENQKKLKDLEEKIILTANNHKKSLQEKLNRLNQEIRQANSKIRSLPAKELQLAELKRERSVADDIYSSVLVRYNQAKIADAVEVGDIIVLDKAVVPPSSGGLMSYAKFMIMGMAFSLGLGIAFVLVMNFFDKTVRTSDELEKAIPIKVVAKIPVIFSEKTIDEQDVENPSRIDPKLVTTDYSPTPVGEAYRSLRTQILFNNASSKDGKVKSMFITSLNPGEGKSLNVSNLAITLAQQKLPTLLIDADLRRGVLHHSFACKKKPGLSDFLYSDASITDENLRKIIQQTHIPNLYLMSSGMPVPNPSEILGSQRGREIIEFVKKRFGFLLLDTPPIMLTSDAVIVSQYTDTGLFVVRAGKSNVDKMREKIYEYKDFTGKISGIILNFAKLESEKKNYKYSYYNY